MSRKEEYDNEPIFYCNNCLSLKIRSVDQLDNSEYCEECSSTDIGQISIKEWDAKYVKKYGHHYLDKH